jgi:Flp pilus assembly protein TadD
MINSFPVDRYRSGCPLLTCSGKLLHNESVMDKRLSILISKGFYGAGRLLSFALFSAFLLPALPALSQDDSGLVVLELETSPDGQLLVADEAVETPGAAQPPSLLPETDSASSPQEVEAVMPPAAELIGAEDSATTAPAQDVAAVPAEPVVGAEGGVFNEDLFFDAEALVPSGQMAPGAPRKVDPRYEPASKLIVVKKNYNSDTTQAQLVSAERAMKLGRYESALTLYDQLYAKSRRDPRILIGRAAAYQHLGQPEAAIHSYEELLALSPNNVEAQVNMLGLMGQTYPAVALRRLLELSKKYPENVGIAAQVAVVQAELGQYDEALRYLGMAAAMEPKNAGHLYNMAVIADRTGKKKQAIMYYEQALEVDSIYGGSRTIPRDSVFERLAQIR